MPQQRKRKYTTKTFLEKLEILNKIENGDKLEKPDIRENSEKTKSFFKTTKI